jgi:hypothetical protein
MNKDDYRRARRAIKLADDIRRMARDAGLTVAIELRPEQAIVAARCTGRPARKYEDLEALQLKWLRLPHHPRGGDCRLEYQDDTRPRRVAGPIGRIPR